MSSVYLYPSLCLFEGTVVSVGRGTDKPFQVLGHPKLASEKYVFTPVSIAGAAKNPKLKGKECFGYDLSGFGETYISKSGSLYIYWLLDVYKQFPDKEHFFTSSFNRLAGTDKLKQQIIAGMPEADIRASWEKELVAFKQTRKKYLLYPDFE